MIKIVVIKNETAYFGSIPRAAKIIKVHPETIKRWIKSKKSIVNKNDCIIYLSSEKL